MSELVSTTVNFQTDGDTMPPPSIAVTTTQATATLSKVAGYRWYCFEIVNALDVVVRRKQVTLAADPTERPATFDAVITGLVAGTNYIGRAKCQNTGAYTDL